MNEFTTDHKDGCLPGIGPFKESVTTELTKKLLLRGNDYTPRTHHLQNDGSAKYTNRLLLENSPYLLQHAHNPVNWFPWGDDAFQLAKELNRPVFLSIGYSTCHWCHVMEDESFENEQIAEYLNQHYVCIKVDREERPDIDSLYMTAVQAIAGRGGWPMSMWLTPDSKPFFGGTYFPAFDGDRGQQFGFLSILKNIADVFNKEPTKINSATDELLDVLQKNLTETNESTVPDRKTSESVIANYTARFDQNFGGVIPAPKFPSSMSIKLLLRELHRTQDKTLLIMATRTLNNMAAGGIHDHIGGGFHRYSTDAQWLVPHFEKMLYDNALICVNYLEAYQTTQNDHYKKIALEILHYVARDMSNDLGAFYSATDADSIGPDGHRNEGYFFTWTADEISQVIDDKKYLEHYNVSDHGNFEGRNILHTAPDAVITDDIIAANKTLLTIRNKRNQPLLDDKVLTSWNALMISAFAKASFICNDHSLLDRAIHAAQFILDNFYVDQKLYRTYKDGVKKHLAFIDDYAYLIQSMLDLFEASFDIAWLEMAIKLDRQVAQQFEDQEHGGFFISSTEQEPLLVREKPVQDGALPSGNSIMVMNLLRLNTITSDDHYRQRAQMTLEVFGDLIYKASSSTTDMLCALDYYHDTPKEIIVVLPQNASTSDEPLLNTLRTTYIPNKVIMCITQGQQYDSIPMLQNKVAIENKPTVYVCEQGACQQPIIHADKLSSLLKTL